MRYKKVVDAVGTALLIIGFFLAFLPHAVHIAAGLDNETSHAKHVVIGMALVVIALAILIYNNKALKLSVKK